MSSSNSIWNRDKLCAYMDEHRARQSLAGLCSCVNTYVHPTHVMHRPEVIRDVEIGTAVYT